MSKIKNPKFFDIALQVGGSQGLFKTGSTRTG